MTWVNAAKIAKEQELPHNWSSFFLDRFPRVRREKQRGAVLLDKDDLKSALEIEAEGRPNDKMVLLSSIPDPVRVHMLKQRTPIYRYYGLQAFAASDVAAATLAVDAKPLPRPGRPPSSPMTQEAAADILRKTDGSFDIPTDISEEFVRALAALRAAGVTRVRFVDGKLTGVREVFEPLRIG